MPDNYTLVGTIDQPLVLSSTETQPGTTVQFVTHPHEVFCQATLPQQQVKSIGYNTVAEPLAFNIERLFSDGTVVGAYFAQVTDDSGLLQDTMVFIVGKPVNDPTLGGMLTAEVPLTIRELYLLSDNMGKFTEAQAGLDAIT